MDDVEIHVGDVCELQRAAEALGAAGVGLEGGGMWAGSAHYLVFDGCRAQSALRAAGFGGVVVRTAVLADLDADVPGALGRMLSRLAAADVQPLAQYSDHRNRKVLVGNAPDAIRRALDVR